MKVGDSLEARVTVRPSDSAAALELSPDDSFPDVFATSRPIGDGEHARAIVTTSRLLAGAAKRGPNHG